MLLETIRHAERTRITEPALLDAFGVDRATATAGDLWSSLLDKVLPDHPEWTPLLRRMLDAGTLASRIRAALPPEPTRAALRALYVELADCLHEGALFRVP